MILVTVGSQLPFDRLVAPVAAWARARGVRDIFFQHGGGAVDLAGFESADFVKPDEAARLFDRARVVVAHVGMGTILGCLERAKPVVVLPRTAALGETRNDHQVACARRFEGRPGIFVAWEPEALAALLDQAESLAGAERIDSHAQPALLAAVRAFVHGRDPGAR